MVALSPDQPDLSPAPGDWLHCAEVRRPPHNAARPADSASLSTGRHGGVATAAAERATGRAGYRRTVHLDTIP